MFSPVTAWSSQRQCPPLVTVGHKHLNNQQSFKLSTQLSTVCLAQGVKRNGPFKYRCTAVCCTGHRSANLWVSSCQRHLAQKRLWQLLALSFTSWPTPRNLSRFSWRQNRPHSIPLHASFSLPLPHFSGASGAFVQRTTTKKDFWKSWVVNQMSVSQGSSTWKPKSCELFQKLYKYYPSSLLWR